MVIGNQELLHQCFPKHSRMGMARIKQDKKTDKDGKKRGMSIIINNIPWLSPYTKEG